MECDWTSDIYVVVFDLMQDHSWALQESQSVTAIAVDGFGNQEAELS
jgi:hypothetical protein